MTLIHELILSIIYSFPCQKLNLTNHDKVYHSHSEHIGGIFLTASASIRQRFDNIPSFQSRAFHRLLFLLWVVIVFFVCHVVTHGSRSAVLYIPCYCGNTIHKFCLKQHIGIIKHSILQGNHNELQEKQVNTDQFIIHKYAKCTYLTGKINSLFHVINACNCSVNQQYSVTCECLKWDLIIWPMFWVCDISRAASTSSRMYRGAGLNNSMARIRDRAISDLHTKQNNPWLHNGIIYNIIMNFSNLQ